MRIGSKEHYDVMAQFERNNPSLRLDREKNKELWKNGNIYEDGNTNNLFKSYRSGYSFGMALARTVS